MNYKNFKGLVRNSVVLVKNLMQECSEDLVFAMSHGELHQYLFAQVDNYLQSNGVRADRKSLNVITDLGKEMFITSTVEDLFCKKGVL